LRPNAIKEAGQALALPGVRINTSASNNMIWTQLQLQRWTGTGWEHFGEILDGGSE
jgi:branched-chain amino acid transport system substrate-binding protein